ncbi:hypothetical protein I79_006268 [Cricetulus griseus]|uniref:Uncharacterized protein n=1 Tax=Cricetulus griseus TaxID=10029 RepID=G3H7D8_CRIGR|nr:hypothetical protein I79_006268 [Cricetulus griseus]
MPLSPTHFGLSLAGRPLLHLGRRRVRRTFSGVSGVLMECLNVHSPLLRSRLPSWQPLEAPAARVFASSSGTHCPFQSTRSRLLTPSDAAPAGSGARYLVTSPRGEAGPSLRPKMSSFLIGQ